MTPIRKALFSVHAVMFSGPKSIILSLKTYFKLFLAISRKFFVLFREVRIP